MHVVGNYKNKHNRSDYDQIVVHNLENTNIYMMEGPDHTAKDFQKFIEKSQLKGVRIQRVSLASVLASSYSLDLWSEHLHNFTSVFG